MHRHVVTGLGALLASAAIAPAMAQDAPVRGTKAVPDRPARVFVLAAFDKACGRVADPVIQIDQAPAKGTVTFRHGQETTIQYSLSGQCVGKKVAGTGIYYTAARGQSGRDTFTITARLATGEVASRTFTVDIADD